MEIGRVVSRKWGLPAELLCKFLKKAAGFNAQNLSLTDPGYRYRVGGLSGKRVRLRRTLDEGTYYVSLPDVGIVFIVIAALNKLESLLYEITLSASSEAIIDKFIRRVVERPLENLGSPTKLKVYRSNSDGEWLRGQIKVPRLLETVFLPASVKNKICDDLGAFLSAMEAYEGAGRPWKRVYLLSGKPGMGKSSFIHALACSYQMRLAIPTLTGLTDADFDNVMRTMPSKSIMLLEDVDHLFGEVGPDEPGYNMSGKATRRTVDCSVITLSGFLNLLDGINTPSGLVIFMTSNHPERLPAEAMRAGRVDVHVKADALQPETLTHAITALCPAVPKSQVDDLVPKLLAPGSRLAIPNMATLHGWLFDHRHADTLEPHLDELAELVKTHTPQNHKSSLAMYS